MAGGPFTYLTERFNANVDALTAYAGDIADAVRLQGQRQWMTPDVGPNSQGDTWDGDPSNLSGSTSIIAAYDRTEINNLYIDALQTAGTAGGGRVGDVRVAKAQNDYLAAQERAYTLRTASVPRCMAFSAARRQGHSSSTGIFGVITKNMNDVLAAAWSDNPNAPAG